MIHHLSIFFLLWLYQGLEVTGSAGEPFMWPEMNPAWMVCPHKASSLCEMSWLTQLLAMQWFVHIIKPPPHLAQMNASRLKQPGGYWLKRKPEPLWWISSLHPILASRVVPDHKVGMEFSLLLPLWHLICEDISLHFHACQSSSLHKHYINLNAELLLYKKFRRHKL